MFLLNTSITWRTKESTCRTQSLSAQPWSDQMPLCTALNSANTWPSLAAMKQHWEVTSRYCRSEAILLVQIWFIAKFQLSSIVLFVSYRIVSYRIVSYRIVSFDFVSYRIVWFRIVSYRNVSYRIVSYSIVSYRIVLFRLVLFLASFVFCWLRKFQVVFFTHSFADNWIM